MNARSTRNARSDATRAALMRAVEKLAAERGLESVSIRDIVSTAGQKNESALHYHFGSLKGLISALHAAREEDIQARRRELIGELLARSATPSLRDICKLMVQPAFELARARPDFRRYVMAFGHEVALSGRSAVELVNRKGGETARETGVLLRAALPQLDEAAFQRRMDGAVRYVSAAMVHHARQKGAFRGRDGELFFSSLIDALVGLLAAPESDETRAIVESERASQRTQRG
jgi:AcrR family transcriptional regulator